MIEVKNIVDIPEVLWQTIYSKNRFRAPFFTYTWHVLWFELFGSGWEPWILIINNNCIAPFARKAETVMFSGGREIGDYLDLIGPDNEKQQSWKEILAFCKGQGIKQLDLFNIPEDSPTLSFFQSANKEDTTPHIHLPPTWEAYLKKLERKDRHELKRKMKNFETTFPGVSFDQSDNPNRDINELLRLMREDKEKEAFLTQPMNVFFKRLPEVFSSEITLLCLKDNDQIIAAMMGFRQDRMFLTYNSGFDTIHYSGAGFYLKAKSIQWAMSNGYEVYNFLQGDERYKYDLGGEDFFVYEINVTP